jgi:hypothetical protein
MKNFQDILDGLSPLLGMDLQADANQACLLVLNEQIRIQLELDPKGECIILASMIIDLPPGRFRENVLKSALKTNSVLQQNRTILCFVAKANKLVLFEEIPLIELTAEKLYAHILDFFHKAENWKSAIEGGKSAPLGAVPEPDKVQGTKFFGIR